MSKGRANIWTPSWKIILFAPDVFTGGVAGGSIYTKPINGWSGEGGYWNNIPIQKANSENNDIIQNLQQILSRYSLNDNHK